MRRRGLLGSNKGIKIEFDGELLCFTPESSSQFKFTKDIYYSIDQENWLALPANTNTPILNTKVWWYANLTPTSSDGIGTFSSTGKFNVSGNPRCLLKDNELASFSFYKLFYSCTNLIDTFELILDTTTLANYCYSRMFYGCTSLTTAPELPATTLAGSCYSYMFYNCTGLTQAPELPATTLAGSCYYHMFYNCTGLTTAPELPATTLAGSCYYSMFYNCNGLNYVKSHATNISASYCLTSWLSRVSNTGEFHKPVNVAYPSGDSGIPSGWTVYEDI